MTNPTQKKIELQNKGYALVDAIDFEWLSEYRWRQTADRRGQGYAAAWDTKLKRTVYMHRLLMGASKGQEVDHKNGDTLDNRRCNLRCATRAQNAANMDKYSSNTSGYKCVFWDKTNKKWKVQMSVNNRQVSGGAYDDKEEAALAYNVLAAKLLGDFSRPNAV